MMKKMLEFSTAIHEMSLCLAGLMVQNCEIGVSFKLLTLASAVGM